MFAVVGRGLYANADPVHFGNLQKSLFTLFQLLTLDDWYEIYQIVSKKDPSKEPLVWGGGGGGGWHMRSTRLSLRKTQISNHWQGMG